MLCRLAPLEELLYTDFSCFCTRVHLNFWVFFWPFFHFLYFLAKFWHFLYKQEPKRCLVHFVSAFSSLLAAVYNIFCKVPLVSVRTSAQNQEKHQKTPKWMFFFSNVFSQSFSQKNTSWVSLHSQKTSITGTKIFLLKKSILKIFANYEPSERHFRSQRVHLCHAFSPHLDRIQTCGLDH